MTRLVLDAEVPGGYREAEPAPPGVRVSSRAPLRGVRVESFDCDDEPRSVYLLDLPSREAGYLAERVDRVMEEASRAVAPSMSQTHAAWKVFDDRVGGLLRYVGSYQIVEATYDAAWDVVSSTRLNGNTDDLEAYHRLLMSDLAETRDGYDSPHVELLLRIALCKAVVCLIIHQKSRGAWVEETEESLRRSFGHASRGRYSVSFGFGCLDVGTALAASFRAKGAYESTASTAEG